MLFSDRRMPTLLPTPYLILNNHLGCDCIDAHEHYVKISKLTKVSVKRERKDLNQIKTNELKWNTNHYFMERNRGHQATINTTWGQFSLRQMMP